MSSTDTTLPMATPPLSSSPAANPQETQLKRGAFEPPVVPGTLGKLERFDIVRLIGEGGMGQVYLAREPLTDTHVAVKIMRPELVGDPQSVHRFLTEARHMYQLSHPRILRVLEVSDRKAGPYYVMPYVDGGSLLGQYRPDRPLRAEQVLSVARQVAEALAHAHSHGIIHRDLKPGNVLLDKDGNAYLTDFGLVRTVFNDSMIDASSSHLEGTAPYMSPAVARGEAEDTRCDIYAFGALLYELLAGHPPYTGRTPQLILDQVLKGPPAPLRTVNSKASPALVRIAEGCLARELRDRYAAMADVVADLDRVVAGKTPHGPRGRQNSLPRLAALLVAAFAVAALAGISAHQFSADSSVIAKITGAQSPVSSVLPKKGAPASPAVWNTKTRDAKSEGLYMVVDLSGGPTAASYPVTYLDAVPSGGWTDEFKTDKLVLRKIEPGTFVMGSPEDEVGRKDDEKQHEVTLTEGFYIGMFEVTQRQWERVKGDWPSHFDNLHFRDKRPVERVSYNNIRGTGVGAAWPTANGVDTTSFMGRLRAKTGKLFDLPTEAQWEYACRAGTTCALNSDKNLTSTERCQNVAEVARYKSNAGNSAQNDDATVGSAEVGSTGYWPNAWGLYDMHGNVWEWCLDWGGNYSGVKNDPKGCSTGSFRVLRGGSWDAHARNCRSAGRAYDRSPDYSDYGIGFRVSLLSPQMAEDADASPANISAIPSVATAQDLSAHTTNNGAPTIAKYACQGRGGGAPKEIKGASEKETDWVSSDVPRPNADGWITLFDGYHLYGCTDPKALLQSGKVYLQDGYLCLSNTTICFNLSGRNVAIRVNGKKVTGLCFGIRLRDGPVSYYAGFFKGGDLFGQGKGNRSGEFVDLEQVHTRDTYDDFIDMEYSAEEEILKLKCNGQVVSQIQDSSISNGPLGVDASVGLSCFREIEALIFDEPSNNTDFNRPGTKGWGPTFGGRPTAVWNGDATAQPAPADGGLYLVVDLSAGTNATRYPVTYQNAAPVGGWTDEYKTDKLVLRRIEPGTFMMGSPNDELARDPGREAQHLVTLTAPFYLGVFEVTQRQWELVTGTRPSYFNNPVCYASRPVESVSYAMIGDGSPSDTFMGRLRSRTGLSLSLPSDAQWEYACRAGSATSFGNGQNLSAANAVCPELAAIARYCRNNGASEGSGCARDVDTRAGTAAVGSYAPNEWGLFDMHGNVYEWTEDWWAPCTNPAALTDPKGPADGRLKTVRGGSWNAEGTHCRAAARPGSRSLTNASNAFGFRVFVPVAATPASDVGAPRAPIPFTYTTNSGSIVITRYTGPGGDVEIPATVGGLPVVAIGEQAFQQCAGLTGVRFPASVAHIGDHAFEHCTNLASVAFLPDSQLERIGDWAFHHCVALSDFNFPKRTTAIGSRAFSCCFGFTRVEIPAGVSTIGEHAFHNCGYISSFHVDDANTTYCSAGGVLFDKAMKTLIRFPPDKHDSYAIPLGVARIENWAFYKCDGITRLAIPASVVDIASASFGSCPALSEILVDDANPFYRGIDGGLYDKKASTLLAYPGGAPETFDVPAGVKTIGMLACEGNRRLSRVTLPDSLVSIKEAAFLRCLSLTHVCFKGAPPNLSPDVFGQANQAVVYHLPGRPGWNNTFGGRPTKEWKP